MTVEDSIFENVVGANVPYDPESPRDDFAFLDGIDEDDCYMPIDTQRPSKSYDFGENGYTASVTTWHELLQLTAPNHENGVVFVRGDFPDSPNSILARSQRRNPRGTFGLGIYVDYKSSDTEERRIPTVLEQTSAHGMINMRYPSTRLNYVQNDAHGLPDIVADYTACSFVKNGTLYQIIRVAPREADDSPSPTMGGGTASPATKPRAVFDINANIGGLFRFGSPRNLSPDDSPHTPALDSYEEVLPDSRDDGPCYVLACQSKRYRTKLEMRLWVDRKAIDLREAKCKTAPVEYTSRIEHEVDAEGWTDDIFYLQAVHPVRISASAINIVATFTLVDSGTVTHFSTEQRMITNTEAQMCLGYAESSTDAPYRLWSYIKNQAPGLEALDLNATGRCAEAILGVSVVPVPDEDDQEWTGGGSAAKDKTGAPFLLDQQLARPARRIALIRNIMAAQVVEFNSMLSKRNVLMLAEYKQRLCSVLKGILCWILDVVPCMGQITSADLVRGLLPSDVYHHSVSPDAAEVAAEMLPEVARCSRSISVKRGRRLEDERARQRIRMRSQRWYCAIMIWYLVRNLPDECMKDSDLQEGLWNALRIFTSTDKSNKFTNQDNRTDTDLLDDTYGCILRWYHSFAVWRIAKYLRHIDQEKFDGLDIDIGVHKDLSDHWQAKAEKSLRLFGQGRHLRHILDHEVAYLAVVGTREELDVDPGPRIQLGVNYTCLEYVTKLIHDRPESKTLYPGASRVSRWDADDVRSAVKRPGPWELNCLAHHVPLCLGLDQESDDGIMEKCWRFLLSDSLFLGSVDPTKIDTACQWWDLTASSIICTQLLVETNFSLQHRQSWGGGGTEPSELQKGARAGTNPKLVRFKSTLTEEPRGESPSRRKAESSHATGDRLSPIHVEGAEEEEKRKQYAEGLTWWRRLPLLLFHPDTTVQCLRNTPGLFGINQTRDVFLCPQIQKNFEEKWKAQPAWTLDNIMTILTPQLLRHISCVDFSLSVDTNARPELVISHKVGRIQCVQRDLWTGIMNFVPEPHRQKMAELLVHEIRHSPGLLDLYFEGKQREHPSFKDFPNEVKDALKSVRVRQQFLPRYQSSLLRVLNDNMVDLGTRYRLLCARELNSETMRAMVYMWHPDALDTFESHLGQLSQFSDFQQQVPRGGEDIWVTSITLSHWRLEDHTETKIRRILEKDPSKSLTVSDPASVKAPSKEWWPDFLAYIRNLIAHGQPPKQEGDTPRPGTNSGKNGELSSATNELDFPPVTVPDARKYAKRPYQIRELSVSLCFTGDWGRYWTCTLVSELVTGSMATRYADETRAIMQMFIHQPYTGRVLVFLLLLSHLVESLAVESEKFLGELELIMEMEPLVLLRGMAWSKSDVALKKLKRMLWGLEALRIFSDKLGQAMSEIARAKAKVDTWVLVGHDVRHPDMERERQRVFEEFEKRRERLEYAHGNIKQRIEQGGRLREGISSVIGVEQNENISMLTWVTIAYLPLAFVAGLFSMDHVIVPLDAGWKAYGWMTAAFLVGTWIFALTLQYWITTFRHLSQEVQTALQPVVKPSNHQNGTGGATGVGVARDKSKTFMMMAGAATAETTGSERPGFMFRMGNTFSHIIRRTKHADDRHGTDEEAGVWGDG
ncbi:hypothetical protein V8F20_007878 [Naviculisporaceae sp. PSN 640]